MSQQSNDPAPSDENSREIDSVSIDRFIFKFQRRANLYLYSGIAILITIVVLIGMTGYIFFFAQYIARGSPSAGAYKQIQLVKDYRGKILQAVETATKGVIEEEKVGQRTTLDAVNAREELYRVRIDLALIKQKEIALDEFGFVNDLNEAQTKEELAIVNKHLEAFRNELVEIQKAARNRFDVGEITQTDLAQIDSKLGKIDAEIVLNKAKYSSAPVTQDAKKETGELDTIELIRVNVVRFGGVSILLILIGILTPVYKYNTRLSGFYQARADALALYKNGGFNDFQGISAALTPTYEFEVQAKTAMGGLPQFIEKGMSTMKS